MYGQIENILRKRIFGEIMKIVNQLKKEWYKILFVGCINLFSMVFFQTIIRGLLFGKILHIIPREHPELAFLYRISIFSFLSVCLFTFAYLLIGDQLSVKGSIKRGIVFGLFIYFSNYLPQSMGLIGAGGDELLMHFSANDAIFDFFSYLITYAFMGWLFKATNNEQIKLPKLHIIKTMVVGSLIFPIMMIIVTQSIAFLFPSQNIIKVLRIGSEYELSFYISFYSLFILTGLLLPLFYYLSDYNRKTLQKEIKFALKYVLLIWIPIVFAMVVFGVETLPCIVFSLESIIVFLLFIKISDYILNINLKKYKAS